MAILKARALADTPPLDAERIKIEIDTQQIALWRFIVNYCQKFYSPINSTP